MTTTTEQLAAEWVRIQEKTFTRWINSKLLCCIDEEPITDLRTGLADGVYLTYLVSYLSPYSIDPVHRKPKHRLQKMENLNAVFDFMKYNEIHLYNIGSEDILEGNFKLILGLIWTLLLHFSSMQKTSNSVSSMKDNLLLWCQQITKGYRHVRITDFTSSWNNGMALCAMIHHFYPDYINYSKLKPENRLQNATLALEIATRKLNIPQLIDIEDLICDNPDEKSITAYIIEWHHKFENVKKEDSEKDEVKSSLTQKNEVLEEVPLEVEEEIKPEEVQEDKGPEEVHEDILPEKVSEKKEEEIATSKETEMKDLLLWCNNILRKLDKKEINNFATGFEDGSVLYSMINELSPESTVDIPENDITISRVTSAIHENFGIETKINNLSEPSREEIISTLELLRLHCLTQRGTETSMAQLEKFIEATNETLELEHDYEKRAAHLIDCIDEQLLAWGTLSHINHCKNYEEIVNERRALEIYKLTLKRKWLKEKSELSVLLSNIKTKLTTYNLHPYYPPGDLSPKFIDCLWLSLTDIEKEALRRINLISKRIQDELCQKYATSAEVIHEIISSCDEKLIKLSDTLEEQLEILTKLLERLEPVEELLVQLQNLDISCKEAQIVNNDYTPLSYDELYYEYVIIRDLIGDKVSFIESQAQVRNRISERKISTAQLKEFEDIFNKVDKLNKNCLSLKEFENTFKILDLEFDDEEVIELFNYGKEKKHDGIKLNGFLKVMTELVGSDDLNADDLIKSFKKISGGKPFVTIEDLRNSKLNSEMILKIQKTFPKYQEVADLTDEDEDHANASYDFIQIVSEVAGLSMPGEGETLDGASISSRNSNLAGTASRPFSVEVSHKD